MEAELIEKRMALVDDPDRIHEFCPTLDLPSIVTRMVAEEIKKQQLAIATTQHIGQVQPAPSDPSRTHELETQQDWHELWPMACNISGILSKAVRDLQNDVIKKLPRRIPMPPEGPELLDYVRTHYSDLEKMTRRLSILSEILLFRSPKVMDSCFHPGMPRY